MRINLASIVKNPIEHGKLVQHWITLIAEEYLVDTNDVYKWLHDPKGIEFVRTFLRGIGWDLECYETPRVSDRSYSHGFVLNNECGELMKWRLRVSCE
jgi:hypothetical protein